MENIPQQVLQYPSENRGKLKEWTTTTLIILFGGILVYFALSFGEQMFFRSQSIPPIKQVLRTLNQDNGLEQAVEDVLEGTIGSYSVAVKDLKTGQSYYRNENRIYDAASLYKLWVMAETFDQIEKGQLKEDQALIQDAEELNKKFDIASESAEVTEGEVKFSVEEALRQMITISHNYAALLLSEKVRLSNVKTFLQQHGLTKSSIGVPPKTTAFDIALFFEKLYNGELANRENTAKMLDLLKLQRLNNKLPRNLPDDVDIAHKTGELGRFTHDAGIVYSANGDYIIVVFSESNEPDAAADRIADVSRAVYTYFQQ